MFSTFGLEYIINKNSCQGGIVEKVMLGKKIKEIRDGKGLSQIDVSAKAGISTSTLSLIENGKKNPQKTTLKCILDVLGVAESELS